MGRGTVAILWATLLIAVVSLGLQMETVRRHFSLRSLWPSWQLESIRELFGFGCFSWLQGLVGLFTGQADRFLVGYLLGAQSVAYYSLCVQVALPIHGIASAGLQVLFPYLAARLGVMSVIETRRKLWTAFTANVALVAILAVPVVFGSHFILRLWMGADFAAHASVALSVMAIGFALLGLNVTGYYVLMALGRIRLLALVNLIGAVAMLAAIAILAPRFGIVGAAVGRLVYGPITWVTYLSLTKTFRMTESISGDTPVMLGAL
jgi:O-antigen/teichoic acid export membrane protein